MSSAPSSTGRALQVGLLAWVLPGAGHWITGHRGMAAVFFIAITFPYWTGVAIGGVKDSVNPVTNSWLFLAELGCGAYTGIGYVMSRSLPTVPPTEYSPYISYYPESDVAQIYLAAAGLLNVLAILDALTRAQTGGLPTFHRDLVAEDAPRGGG